MPHVKESYYFPHDANARHDPNICMMRAKYGTEGYGVYWIIIEMLRNEQEYKLQFNHVGAIDLQANIDYADNFISDCIEHGLFTSDGTHFWSESLVKRMAKKDEIRQKQSDGGKVSAEKRKEHLRLLEGDSKDKPKSTSTSKVKESKEKESKELFEHLWSIYPRKKGKGGVSDFKKLELLRVGKDQMQRCVERFKKDMDREQRPPDKILYGSTFFNTGYIDYLDSNFTSKPTPKDRVWGRDAKVSPTTKDPASEKAIKDALRMIGLDDEE